MPLLKSAALAPDGSRYRIKIGLLPLLKSAALAPEQKTRPGRQKSVATAQISSLSTKQHDRTNRSQSVATAQISSLSTEGAQGTLLDIGLLPLLKSAALAPKAPTKENGATVCCHCSNQQP